jgi:hypothetical protein
MTEYTKAHLLALKMHVLTELEVGKLAVSTAATILGMTRQGVWKLRKRWETQRYQALLGRKRGPKSYHRVHNRTPELVEEQVANAFIDHGVGIDSLQWVLEDLYGESWIPLSRSTIYRILIRRRLLTPNDKPRNYHTRRYAKGYPGEEVQLDATEPFGKGKIIEMDIVDDFSRYSGSYAYVGNTAVNAATAFQHFVDHAPFPVIAVRVDNGSETRKEFEVFCKRRGIIIRRNPPRTPQHNGKVERLHRTIEEECLWRIPKGADNPPETIQYYLTQYINWYNTKRKHQGYHMGCTPQYKIEQWILDHQSDDYCQSEVNETLILYTD